MAIGRIKKLSHSLGGARLTSMFIGSGWQNVPNYIDIDLNGDDLTGIDVRAYVELLVVSGESVTPRVLNVTDDVVAGYGVACTAFASDYSGLHQKQAFDITITTGTKKYRLQGGQAPGNDGAYVIGFLQIGDLT